MCELEVQIANFGVGLLGDFGFLASLWDGLAVRNFHFDLPLQHRNLPRFAPLDWQENPESTVGWQE
jgi:hypothetical protein